MGMFKTENCPICGLPTGAFSKSLIKYNGNYVCQNCIKKLTENKISTFKIKNYQLEELKKIIETAKQCQEQHMVTDKQINRENKFPKKKIKEIFKELSRVLEKTEVPQNLECYKNLLITLENYKNDRKFDNFAIIHSQIVKHEKEKKYVVFYNKTYIGNFNPKKQNFRKVLISQIKEFIHSVESKSNIDQQDIEQKIQVDIEKTASKKTNNTAPKFNISIIPVEEREYLAKVIDQWVLVYSYNVNLCIFKEQYQIEDFEGTERMLIDFKKEPENIYDKNAIAAYIGKDKVGYVYRGKIQDMLNDWIKREEKVVSYIKKINLEDNKIEYRIGFYKLLENYPFKEFTAIKTKQKINEYESRMDNIECLYIGQQLLFEPDIYQFGEENYILTDTDYNEVGELPKSAINYINKKDYKDTVAIVSDIEDKLKFKIYKL